MCMFSLHAYMLTYKNQSNRSVCEYTYVYMFEYVRIYVCMYMWIRRQYICSTAASHVRLLVNTMFLSRLPIKYTNFSPKSEKRQIFTLFCELYIIHTKKLKSKFIQIIIIIETMSNSLSFCTKGVDIISQKFCF